MKPDVYVLSETHLTPVNRFRLITYLCHRNGIVGRQEDDTAIAARSPRPTDVEKSKPPMRSMERCPRGRISPPRVELLVGDLGAFLDPHRSVILVGDLNDKHRDWKSRLTTPNGKRLHRYVETRWLVQRNPRPIALTRLSTFWN